MNSTAQTAQRSSRSKQLMKLITLNVEREKHLDKVPAFLEAENADIVCLQEASAEYEPLLQSLGYQTTSFFMGEVMVGTAKVVDTVLFASKHPHNATQTYYYRDPMDIPDDTYNEKIDRRHCHQGFIFATVTVEDEVWHIATTHFTWTPHGEKPSVAQHEDLESLLESVRNLPPHVLCGDFNIPRHHSPLYAQLTQVYTDTIPASHASSMDKTFHRLGNDQTKQRLFTDFMVDYIFTQEPYIARDVHLHFGVSDHAAVIAEIEKNK